MKKLFLLFVSIFTFAFTQIDSVFAIAVEGVDYPFWFTTIPDATTGNGSGSQFILSAKGTFYIDCVDGTLTQVSGSGSTTSGGTVTRTGVSQGNYKCTWPDNNSHTVRIGGLATAYPSGTTKTLGFNIGNSSNPSSYINSVHGNLSAIFPVLGTSRGEFPTFLYLFRSCKYLTSIPDTLFSGYTTGGTQMFQGVFYGCTGLRGFVSPNLFAGLIANGSPYPSGMMANIFSGANNLLTACPSGTTQVTTGYESYWNNKVSCSGTPTINVTYSCGGYGGTPPSSTTVAYNSSFTPAANTCTVPAGYHFSWWQAYDSYTRIVPGVTFQWQFPSNTTLTAAYKGNFYTATYDCGAGSGNPGNTTYAYGSSYYSPSETQCTPPAGKHLSGWKVSGTNDIIQSNTTDAPRAHTFTWQYLENKTFTAQYTANTINITWDGASGTPASCTYGSTFVPPTPAARTGYIFVGWTLPCVNKIKNLDTSIVGTAYGYTKLDGAAGLNESNYGLTVGSGQWATEFDYGTVWGMAKCSSTSSTYHSDYSAESQSDWLQTPSDTSGAYCWCQVTGFTASGNSYTSGPKCTVAPASSLWVYFGVIGQEAHCKLSCASICANNVRNSLAVRNALFGAAGQ